MSKSSKKSVIIDGVQYVPATEAVVDIQKVLRVLALQYHTEGTLADYGYEGLRIIIDEEVDGGESFEEFAARYAQEGAR